MNGFSSSRRNESMKKMDRIEMAENNVNHYCKSDHFIPSLNYFSFLRNEARCRESTLAIERNDVYLGKKLFVCTLPT